MNWKIMKFDSANYSSKNKAFASVGHGKIIFNAAATSLIKNGDNLNNVEILEDNLNGSKCYGFRFLKDATQNSILVSHRTARGKKVRGAIVANTDVARRLFGILGEHKSTTKYDVIKDTNESSTLMIIDTSNELAKRLTYKPLSREAIANGKLAASNNLYNILK